MGRYDEMKNRGIGYDYFDHYVTTSAGAFNACYFLSEQMEEGKRVWLDHLPKGFWRFFKNDMAYLEKILRVIEPLDCKAVVSRRQKIYVSLSNAKTLQADYRRLDEADDIIPILLSSCAMPLLSGSRTLSGIKYYDGGFVANVPLEKALEFHSAEIWVIATRPKGYHHKNLFWKLISVAELLNRGARKLLYSYPERSDTEMRLVDSTANLKIIRPERVLPIGVRSTNRFLISQTFELGRQAAEDFLRKSL